MSLEEENAVPKKEYLIKGVKSAGGDKKDGNNWIEEETDEAELTVDVYQTPTDIIIQTMVAGVRPEDL